MSGLIAHEEPWFLRTQQEAPVPNRLYVELEDGAIYELVLQPSGRFKLVPMFEDVAFRFWPKEEGVEQTD